jgi:hypothetical protein
MSDPSGPSTPTPLPPPPAYAPPPPAPGPGAMPQPIGPSSGMSTAGLLSQITGVAGLGILFGLATVIVPIVFGWVFYVLPIAGFLAGVEAVRRGQLIGGILAIVLNAMGAMLTLIGVFG